MALVLPKTVLTGESWAATRDRIAQNWHVEFAITSHEADHWNFSDSTDLSEAILIARKWREGEDRTDATTAWVALWRNLDNPIEALAVASALRRLRNADEAGEPIQVGEGLDATMGEAFSRPSPSSPKPWRHGTYSRAVLDAAAEAILDGLPVPLPRLTKPVSIPLSPLTDLASVGPDRARIHDGFVHASLATGYRALWGHDSSAITGLEFSPNQDLDAKAGREAYAARLWHQASTLMVAERLWLHTQRTLALVLDNAALSNMWWPVKLTTGSEDDEAILALWLNSTLGILSFVGASEETRGPFIAVKKNKLQTLRVLDVRSLSQTARDVLIQAWDDLRSAELQPVVELARDPVRAHIDRVVGEALGIPEEGLDALRLTLASEPRWGKPAPRRTARADERDDQLLLPF